MRDFGTEPARAAGPGVVVDGPADAPAVLVIDPAGTGSHGELPASWRGLTEHLRIVWCRLPAIPAGWDEVEKGLASHARGDTTLDVVSSGPVAAKVVETAARHADHVRSVLLVDPEIQSLPSPRGLSVRLVAVSQGGEHDRVEPPLPLGHPDVVIAVVRELLELDEPPATPPQHGTSLVWQAVYAVWESLAQAAGRRR